MSSQFYFILLFICLVAFVFTGLFILIAASIYTARFTQYYKESHHGYSFILAWICFCFSFIIGILYLVLRKKWELSRWNREGRLEIRGLVGGLWTHFAMRSLPKIMNTLLTQHAETLKTPQERIAIDSLLLWI